MQRSPIQKPDEILKVGDTFYVPVEMRDEFLASIPTRPGDMTGAELLMGYNVVWVYPPEQKPKPKWWQRLWAWLRARSEGVKEEQEQGRGTDAPQGQGGGSPPPSDPPDRQRRSLRGQPASHGGLRSE